VFLKPVLFWIAIEGPYCRSQL